MEPEVFYIRKWSCGLYDRKPGRGEWWVPAGVGIHVRASVLTSSIEAWQPQGLPLHFHAGETYEFYSCCRC